MDHFYLELNFQNCINIVSFMKFLKISFFLVVIIFLNGCIQTTALLGPSITVATTGNVMQAGLQYGANTAFKKKTGKDPLEHIKDVVDKEKKDKRFKLSFENFVKTKYQIAKQKLLKTN